MSLNSFIDRVNDNWPREYPLRLPMTGAGCSSGSVMSS